MIPGRGTYWVVGRLTGPIQPRTEDIDFPHHLGESGRRGALRNDTTGRAMRRGQRLAAIIAAITATVASVAVATPARAVPALAVPGATRSGPPAAADVGRTVTLITGDRVTVTPQGGASIE